MSKDLQQKLDKIREKNPWLNKPSRCQCPMCKEEDNCHLQAEKARAEKAEAELGEAELKIAKLSQELEEESDRAKAAEARVAELVGALEIALYDLTEEGGIWDITWMIDNSMVIDVVNQALAKVKEDSNGQKE